MSTTILKTGSSGEQNKDARSIDKIVNSKIAVVSKYVDSQYTTLVKQLESKANTKGDNFSGPINLANNNIHVSSSCVADTPDTLVNKVYVDTLVNSEINQKLNKSGDVMTGNLNMNNNHIINVRDPEADGDVITKRYCDENINSACDILKNDISQVESSVLEVKNNMVRIHGDTIKGTLDMGGHRISNVNYPDSALDAINKKYIQIVSINDDGVKLNDLLPICSILKDVLMKFENEHPNKYYRLFNKKFTYLQNFILTFNRLYDNRELFPVLEKILYSYIKDLKCLTIAIIEEMPINVFIELKEILIMKGLLVTPEGKWYNVRVFIEKFAKNTDPLVITTTRNYFPSLNKNEMFDKHSNDFELLVQKNLMFGEMRFLYVSDSLLVRFVI